VALIALVQVYAPFLDRHHLWGATKAKHGYGLFDKADGTLAAVATFSARRRVLRHGAPHASHELLRLCARRDLSVVGGISKLVAAFVAAHGADDVVTVVDRDWGGAAGWAAAGFARVQTMPPMPMAVGADGRRVHLVGVGLAPAPTDAAAPLSTRDALRAGLPAAAAAALAGAADASAAADCLSACGYALLHDAGVERLLRLTPRASEATAAADAAAAAAAAWAASSPKYASAHYSPNPGVAALCAAAARAPPADGASVAREQASFRQAGPPRLIASAASRAGAGAAGGGGARVEVHARADGWRTLRVDNGLGCHVLHSVVNVDADGVARADAVASEYLLTMAALVLAALEPAEGAGVAAPARCLHLGLGGASLVRLLAAALPGSTHDAVEIDGAVVDALALLGGAGALRDVHVADATEWVAARAAAGARGGYDAILIDCFDHEGGCPPALLAAGCLAAVRGLLSARGVAVHNLHSGGRARQAELALAESAYAAAFGGGGLRVDALDSRPHAGNALLCVGGGLGAAPALRARADAARARAGLECDLGARVAGARPLRAAGGGGGGAAGA
jgi:hypothetical protein